MTAKRFVIFMGIEDFIAAGVYLYNGNFHMAAYWGCCGVLCFIMATI